MESMREREVLARRTPPPAMAEARERELVAAAGRKKFRGVTYMPSGKCSAAINEPGLKKKLWLGTYPKADVAACAYDLAASRPGPCGETRPRPTSSTLRLTSSLPPSQPPLAAAATFSTLRLHRHGRGSVSARQCSRQEPAGSRSCARSRPSRSPSRPRSPTPAASPTRWTSTPRRSVSWRRCRQARWRPASAPPWIPISRLLLLPRGAWPLPSSSRHLMLKTPKIFAVPTTAPTPSTSDERFTGDNFTGVNVPFYFTLSPSLPSSALMSLDVGALQAPETAEIGTMF